MLKLCVLNVKARVLYYKANLILSLSTCQRTRQNVFEYLLSNNLKIRKESPNSSLEEKAYRTPNATPPQEKAKKKKKKKKWKTQEKSQYCKKKKKYKSVLVKVIRKYLNVGL